MEVNQANGNDDALNNSSSIIMFWRQDMIMLSSVTLLNACILLITCLCMGMGYFILQVQKKRDEKYPPFAPGSMREHLKHATGSRLPWWLLDVANQFDFKVFQLSLPVKPMTPYIMIGEPAVARAVLADPLSAKPLYFYKCMRNVTGGRTMFTMNGHGWHAKRKAAAPAFSSKNVKRMNSVALEKTEAWIEDTLMQHSNEGTSFDITQEMLSVVLSALTETAYDYNMSEQEVDMFGDELHLALIEFMRKSLSNPFRRMTGQLLPERRRAYLAVQKLRGMVRHIMDTYRNTKEHLRTQGTIIQLVMESDAYPNDQERAAQLLEFLLAGHETTAFSICWTLRCLAQNPKEQAKLRESLSQLSKENWTSSEYLKCVVKEGMRMYPVARSVRTAGRDITTSNGLLIPKGSICSMNFVLLFRNPDIFDNPASFQPSRWGNPTPEMKDAFHPFSFGYQNCVGQALAQSQTHAIIARICSEFELSVEDEGVPDYGMTLKPVGVRLKARKV